MSSFSKLVYTLFRRIKSPLFLTLISIASGLLVSDYHFRWKNDKWQYTISSDAYDYYRYLPMVLLHNGRDVEKTEAGPPVPIKHYVGTALFFVPFFALAYLFGFIFHFPLDGYAMPFQVFISLGTLFYLMAGLFYLSKLLRLYMMPVWIVCTVIVAAVLATNLFYYTVLAPGWCHPVAFALISFLLYQVKILYTTFSGKKLLLIIVTLSLLFWTRPTDLVIMALLPFIAGSRTVYMQTIKRSFQNKKIIARSLLLAAIPMVIQLITYKMQTGHFMIWSYGGEGKFNFFKPETVNVLFSYAKGFFVYTPIAFMALFGLIPVYKKDQFLFKGMVLFMIVNVYIISSWWCWNYGYCFGSRPFIDFYAVFMLLLAFLLHHFKNRLMLTGIFVPIIFFTILNLVQTYQCDRRILDMDFKTDKKGYWNTFMETDRGYSGRFYRFPVDTSKANVTGTTTFFSNMEAPDTGWINQHTLQTGLAHAGKSSSRVMLENCYSSGIIKKVSEIPYHRNVLIRASGWFYITGRGSNSFFAISFSNHHSSFNFNPFGMDSYITEFGKWEYLVFEMYMPKLKPNKDPGNNMIEFYLYNNSAIPCYVDDLKIEFIEFKKLDRILDIWWDY